MVPMPQVVLQSNALIVGARMRPDEVLANEFASCWGKLCLLVCPSSLVLCLVSLLLQRNNLHTIPSVLFRTYNCWRCNDECNVE